MVEYLFQQGEISKGIFRKGAHLKIMDSNGVQGIEADLLDHHSLHEAMEGVDVVYNMASPMPGSDAEFLKPNTEGLLNLLEVAAESRVKIFVHLSTLEVFGFGSKEVTLSSPFGARTEYQRAKAEAERLLQEFSKRTREPRIAVIRPARALGSRDETLVVPLLRMIDSGKVVLPAGGLMSFTHPRDIAQALYRAATSNLPTGTAFLVKSFDATSEELTRGLAAAAGKKVEVRRQGFLTGTGFPSYTTEQLRASVRIDEQANWKDFGYSPAYDLKGACEEIAGWQRREPWITEST